MTHRYLFTCPDCGAEITVDATVQEELLSAGCVACGSAISQTDFVLET